VINSFLKLSIDFTVRIIWMGRRLCLYRPVRLWRLYFKWIYL
jgi:hypothetical protein